MTGEEVHKEQPPMRDDREEAREAADNLTLESEKFEGSVEPPKKGMNVTPASPEMLSNFPVSEITNSPGEAVRMKYMMMMTISTWPAMWMQVLKQKYKGVNTLSWTDYCRKKGEVEMRIILSGYKEMV